MMQAAPTSTRPIIRVGAVAVIAAAETECACKRERAGAEREVPQRHNPAEAIRPCIEFGTCMVVTKIRNMSASSAPDSQTYRRSARLSAAA